MPLASAGVMGQILDGSNHRSPIEAIRHRRAQQASEKRAEQNHGSYIEWLRTGEKDANWKRKSAEWETALLAEEYLPKMLDKPSLDFCSRTIVPNDFFLFLLLLRILTVVGLRKRVLEQQEPRPIW